MRGGIVWTDPTEFLSEEGGKNYGNVTLQSRPYGNLRRERFVSPEGCAKNLTCERLGFRSHAKVAIRFGTDVFLSQFLSQNVLKTMIFVRSYRKITYSTKLVRVNTPINSDYY